MTNTEFNKNLEKIRFEHNKLFGHEGNLTVNEFVYILRNYFKSRFVINDSDGASFASDVDCFIPSRILSKKISSIKCETDDVRELLGYKPPKNTECLYIVYEE